jgi:hypothetical protein
MSLAFLAENLKRIGVSPVYRHMQTLRNLHRQSTILDNWTRLNK